MLDPMRRLLLSLTLLAGCATTHAAVDPGPPVAAQSTPEHEPAHEPEPAVSPTPEPSPEKATAPTGAGVIPRAALNTVLSASPGFFLQHVDTKPRYRSGHFAGWKLASFFPGDPRFQTVDLHAGDVVTRVNGSTVERPEQLLELWERLKTDKELVVDIERDGQPHTLRWTISP